MCVTTYALKVDSSGRVWQAGAMRILVCVKHVPDLASQRGFLPNGRVNRDPHESVINEVDENAVEAAVQLRAAHPEADFEIVALTMGPEGATEALRRALQLGADRAVHLSDDAIAGSDYGGTARALAALISHQLQDLPAGESALVIMGMAALDGLGSVIPAMTAAELNWPALTLLDRLEVTDDAVVARRSADGEYIEFTAPLPAVVSVTDVINTPRFPRYKDIMAAREKPIEQLSLADIGVGAEKVGQSGAQVHVTQAEEAPEDSDPIILRDQDGSSVNQLLELLVQRGAWEEDR